MLQQTRAARRVGIVDIGSNSVRLVVYGNRPDSFRPLFNDKTACQLGADLNRTGKLNPEGCRLAEQAFQRFINIAALLEVDRFEAYATAAIRDASDGAEFAGHLERVSGRKIDILSGAEEALAGARGVLGAIPDAAGVVADLGGGSLELVRVAGLRAAESDSFPLGVLRLRSRETTGLLDNPAFDPVAYLVVGLPFIFFVLSLREFFRSPLNPRSSMP